MARNVRNSSLKLRILEAQQNLRYSYKKNGVKNIHFLFQIDWRVNTNENHRPSLIRTYVMEFGMFFWLGSTERRVREHFGLDLHFLKI